MDEPRLRRCACKNTIATSVYKTYPGPVGRLSVFFIVMTNFVEIVFIQLTDKTSKIAMLEVLWEYMFCEFFVLVHG